MLLGIGYLHRDAMDKPNPPIIKAGGFFALMSAFMAWYNALAGIADDSNRYVTQFHQKGHRRLLALSHIRLSYDIPGLNTTDLVFNIASSSSPSSTSPGPSPE